MARMIGSDMVQDAGRDAGGAPPAASWLADARADSPLPLGELLPGSLFYPAAGLDGNPVEALGGPIVSFVYADYGKSLEELQQALAEAPFSGYEARFVRRVDDELDLPRSPLGRRPTGVIAHAVEPWAAWVVFDRRPEYGDEHGPAAFSLLYVGLEGVAAFEHLYVAHGAAPRAVAVLQSDGFAANWTKFRAPDGPLARAVMGHPAGVPVWLLVDHKGRGPEAEQPVWDGFGALLGVGEFRSVYGRKYGRAKAGPRKLAVWGRG